jgi:FixJ family two-component response regulator
LVGYRAGVLLSDLADLLNGRVAGLLASGASVPTVFITGHDDDATRERARKAGAVAYLCKPFDDQSLISAIERALARDSF